MTSFQFTVEMPTLGQYGGITWGRHFHGIACVESFDKLLEVLKHQLPLRNPEVQKVLQEQDGFGEDEYYIVYATELKLEENSCLIVGSIAYLILESRPRSFRARI